MRVEEKRMPAGYGKPRPKIGNFNTNSQKYVPVCSHKVFEGAAFGGAIDSVTIFIASNPDKARFKFTYGGETYFENFTTHVAKFEVTLRFKPPLTVPRGGEVALEVRTTNSSNPVKGIGGFALRECMFSEEIFMP